MVGDIVGVLVGDDDVGVLLGDTEGNFEGRLVGEVLDCVGEVVGKTADDVGDREGECVGFVVGTATQAALLLHTPGAELPCTIQGVPSCSQQIELVTFSRLADSTIRAPDLNRMSSALHQSTQLDGAASTVYETASTYYDSLWKGGKEEMRKGGNEE